MLAQAMSSTRAITAITTISGCAYCFRKPDRPPLPLSTVIRSLRRFFG
jgi:hypothetical protein